LTVLEVIRLVADALNAEAHWRQVPDRRVHDRSYAMSCSRIRELGWSPRRDVTDSIKCAATAIAAAAADGDCPLFTELR
jgi:nucleoside-diphosphate-sugar epimerase